MKIKNTLTLLLLLTSFFYCFSQKIKLRNGEVLVDNMVWLRYLDGGIRTCSLLNLHGEELVFINNISTSSTNVSYYGVTETYDSYYEVKFLGTRTYFEIRSSLKKIMQILYASRVIDTEGRLDKEQAARLVEKYGTSISDAAENRNNNINYIPPPARVVPVIPPPVMIYSDPYWGYPDPVFWISW